MYSFGRRSSLLFLAEGKYHISGKKKYHIHRICRKYHISMYFLRKIIFHFPSENKIMLSGKNTIIHNTRKVIFQCNFFRKTILSEHLEKKNLVFCAVIRNRSRGFVVTLCGFVVTLCCFGTTLCGFRVMWRCFEIKVFGFWSTSCDFRIILCGFSICFVVMELHHAVLELRCAAL